MAEVHPTPETVTRTTNPLMRAQEVVEKAWTGLKVSKNKALPIALAGSLFFSAACGTPESTSAGIRPTATATAAALPTVEAPVAVEQGKFNEDFWKITRAVQELVRPETLKENPTLEHNLAFYPDKLQSQSERGFFIEQKQPPSKGYQGWRRLIFKPEQSRGTAIYVTETEKGEIYNIQIQLNVSADGKHETGSEWSANAIQDGDLPQVMTRFFNIPEGVDLKWEKSRYSDFGQISGSADVEGTRYWLLTSRTGGSLFSISYPSGKSPIYSRTK